MRFLLPLTLFSPRFYISVDLHILGEMNGGEPWMVGSHGWGAMDDLDSSSVPFCGCKSMFAFGAMNKFTFKLLFFHVMKTTLGLRDED